MTTTTVVFEQRTHLGTITIEPFDVAACSGLLYEWVTHPRAVYWGMLHAAPKDVTQAYEAIDSDHHHHTWLGRLDEQPLFLTETYAPEHSELRSHYEVEPGDIGMHVLVAPPTARRLGLTSAVMRAVMTFVLSDERCRRVVVEPDVRNDRIAAKNAEAGFVEQGQVQLSDKLARLSFCTREAFSTSALGRRTS